MLTTSIHCMYWVEINNKSLIAHFVAQTLKDRHVFAHTFSTRSYRSNTKQLTNKAKLSTFFLTTSDHYGIMVNGHSVAIKQIGKRHKVTNVLQHCQLCCIAKSNQSLLTQLTLANITDWSDQTKQLQITQTKQNYPTCTY